jgi:hypothetical protein
MSSSNIPDQDTLLRSYHELERRKEQNKSRQRAYVQRQKDKLSQLEHDSLHLQSELERVNSLLIEKQNIIDVNSYYDKFFLWLNNYHPDIFTQVNNLYKTYNVTAALNNPNINMQNLNIQNISLQ